MARTCLEKMFDRHLYEVSLLEIKQHESVAGQWDEKAVQRNLAELGYTDLSDEQLANIKITFGQGDMDPRFHWTRPGTGMRAGPLLMNVAMAYDLCYDGWAPEFRQRVANEIMEYEQPEVFWQKYTKARNMTLERAVAGENYPPGSNHFGFTLGGAGIALLAVRNDPGVDTARVDELLAEFEANLHELLTEGFGDRAYFSEGFGPGHIAANATLIPSINAARVAWGRDYVSPDTAAGEAARWLTLKWIMNIIPKDGDAFYTHVGGAGGYTYDRLGHRGYTDGGEFGQGFGALPDDRSRAALLWTWDKTLGKSEPVNFGVWHYPSKMVITMANWPIGLEPINPGEVLPHAIMDTQHGYCVFRNRWKNSADCVFCFLLNPQRRHGFVKSPGAGALGIFGLDIALQFRVNAGQPTLRSFEPHEDGGALVSFSIDERPHSVAVDYSGQAGAPAVIVVAPAWASVKNEVDAKTKWTQREPAWAYRGREQSERGRLFRRWCDDFAGGAAVMILSEGDCPNIESDGNTLQVGGQTYQWDGVQLRIGREPSAVSD